jgi:hypothetical protein
MQRQKMPRRQPPCPWHGRDAVARSAPHPTQFLRSTYEHLGRIVPKEDLRLLRFAHDASALRSVCASAISGNSGVGEKPLSADASKA